MTSLPGPFPVPSRAWGHASTMPGGPSQAQEQPARTALAAPSALHAHVGTSCVLDSAVSVFQISEELMGKLISQLAQMAKGICICKKWTVRWRGRGPWHQPRTRGVGVCSQETPQLPALTLQWCWGGGLAPDGTPWRRPVPFWEASGTGPALPGRPGTQKPLPCPLGPRELSPCQALCPLPISLFLAPSTPAPAPASPSSPRR